MIFARVTGTVVCTLKDEKLVGSKLLLVQPVDLAGASKGAREAVEKAGGSVVTTFTKKAYMNKKGEPGKRRERRVKSAEKRAARNAG